MSKIILNGIEYSNGITYQELQPVIYSDEEREVGCWTDGKPLYQKTIIQNNATLNSEVSIDVSTLNIDKCVWVGGVYSRNVTQYGQTLTYPFNNYELSNYNSFIRYTDSTKSITYKIALATGNTTDYQAITLQYTKTTDTAGSGDWTPSGVPTVHYDGNEKVIGTWFGETLYEKTWSGLSVSVTQNAWNTINAVTVSNLKDVINTTVYRTGGSGALTSVGVRSFSADNSRTHLQIIPLESQTINYVMMQYTKTS